MNDDVTISRASLAAEASIALITALDAELADLYPEPGATHFRLHPDEVAAGNGAFLVAYRGNEPVGCGAVRLLEPGAAVSIVLSTASALRSPGRAGLDATVTRISRPRPTAEIKRMYVAPSARGGGLGRRLLDALEAEAHALGAHQLVLETGTRQTAAIALYRASGFEPIPLYGEYRKSPDTSLCMAKPLEQHADQE